MATTKITQRRETVECDDCGRRCFHDTAEQITYTCPAVRTVYICRRCQLGETPITITNRSALHR